MAVADIARIEERLDRTEAGAIPIDAKVGGVRFTSMLEVMEFAKLMAIAGEAVPPHLRGKEKAGLCLAICIQALEWRMSPFAVANKSYPVGGKIGFEAQLIHAVVEQRAPLSRRLDSRYEGEGDDRVCVVIAHIKGEDGPREFRGTPIGKIQPKNSPLWKTKPDQQLWYNTVRDFCRKFFPDVLLGIYSEDELRDSHVGPERAKDVTPDKPKFGKFNKSKRGFDAQHVERHTEPESGAQAPAKDSAEPGVSQLPARTTEGIAGTREDKPASGDEARVAVTTSSGPPSILQQYWDAINVDEAIGQRDVAKLSNKFFDAHTVDDAERAQCLRLRTIRDNVLAGFLPRAEGEEKAREIIGA